MSLFARAFYIAEHAARLAGPDFRVAACADNTDWDNVLLVAKGEKPLCEIDREVTVGQIRALPQVPGLEIAALDVFFAGKRRRAPLFGRRAHIEAYEAACKLRNRGMNPEADALFGLAFGYPEDKIARFVLNGIERYGDNP